MAILSSEILANNYAAAGLVGSQGNAYPFAQVLNNEGTIAVELEQAKLCDFDFALAQSNGWEETTLEVCTDDGDEKQLEFLATSNPRMSIVYRNTVVRDDDSKTSGKRYDKYLYVIFLSQDNVALHDGVMQLKLKGGSGIAGSFYTVFDQLKTRDGKPNECWLTDVWNIVPRAKAPMQALFVFEGQLERKMLGQGKNKSYAARFAEATRITEDNLESMFLGSGDPENPRELETTIRDLHEEVRAEVLERSKAPAEGTETMDETRPVQGVEYNEMPF